MHTELNREKLKKLVHYICVKVDDPANLGAIKLNKILWFSDVLAYMNWGTPITGESYIKRQFGPVPAHILSVLEDLQADGTLFIRDVEYYGRSKKEFMPLNDVDYSDLSEDELKLVDSLVGQICNSHTATSISDFSHNAIWEMASIGEEIPYNTMFVARLGEVDESDMEWAAHELESAA